MSYLNRSLLTIIGIGWLSFLVLGLVVQYVFAAPNLVLLIDRSYCPPSQWEKVIQTYSKLYDQHQQQRLKIQQIILFSDLGEETLTTIPSPRELKATNLYGKTTNERQKNIKQNYPKSQLLKCS
jgi:hypothetical protein